MLLECFLFSQRELFFFFLRKEKCPGFGSEIEYHNLETEVFAQQSSLSGLKFHCLNVSDDRKKVSWKDMPYRVKDSRLRIKGFVTFF